MIVTSAIGAGALIGGLAAAGAGIFGNLYNSYQVDKTNANNERLMREAWDREDTAVQRRAADLEAAGLSKTLAAGSAAQSSAPIQMSSYQADTSGFEKAGNILGSAIAEMPFKEQQYDLNKDIMADTKSSAQLKGAQADLAAEQIKTQQTQQTLNLANAYRSGLEAQAVSHDLGLSKATDVSYRNPGVLGNLKKLFVNQIKASKTLDQRLNKKYEKMDATVDSAKKWLHEKSQQAGSYMQSMKASAQRFGEAFMKANPYNREIERR